MHSLSTHALEVSVSHCAESVKCLNTTGFVHTNHIDLVVFIHTSLLSSFSSM